MSRLLSILRAQQGRACGWLTVSDLAIWMYGHDGYADGRAVRQLMRRARHAGHRMEVRSAPWDRIDRADPAALAGRERVAYRLLAVPPPEAAP